jgi:hypothetical protein
MSDLVGAQEGPWLAPNQQVNILFSMERGMEIMNLAQVFWA